jgi:Transcriptional Coactivator p15 (PC4)
MARPAVQDTVIGAVVRQRREEIRVSVRQSKGVKWLDIRVYYEADEGSMQPSQRGVSLSPNEWRQLRQVLQKLRREKDGQADAGTSAQPTPKGTNDHGNIQHQRSRTQPR